MAARARDRKEGAALAEWQQQAPRRAIDKAWDEFCRARDGWGAEAAGRFHGQAYAHGNMIVSAVGEPSYGPFSIAVTSEFIAEAERRRGEGCAICRDVAEFDPSAAPALDPDEAFPGFWDGHRFRIPVRPDA
jgi:hypothetical protein